LATKSRSAGFFKELLEPVADDLLLILATGVDGPLPSTDNFPAKLVLAFKQVELIKTKRIIKSRCLTLSLPGQPKGSLLVYFALFRF